MRTGAICLRARREHPHPIPSHPIPYPQRHGRTLSISIPLWATVPRHDSHPHLWGWIRLIGAAVSLTSIRTATCEQCCAVRVGDRQGSRSFPPPLNNDDVGASCCRVGIYPRFNASSCDCSPPSPILPAPTTSQRFWENDTDSSTYRLPSSASSQHEGHRHWCDWHW